MGIKTDYNKILPTQILFSVRDIDKLGLIKSAMCKKLIYANQLEVIKIGNKLFISRVELIRYLTDRTISAVNNPNGYSKNVA